MFVKIKKLSLIRQSRPLSHLQSQSHSHSHIHALSLSSLSFSLSHSHSSFVRAFSSSLSQSHRHHNNNNNNNSNNHHNHNNNLSQYNKQSSINVTNALLYHRTPFRSFSDKNKGKDDKDKEDKEKETEKDKDKTKTKGKEKEEEEDEDDEGKPKKKKTAREFEEEAKNQFYMSLAAAVVAGGLFLYLVTSSNRFVSGIELGGWQEFRTRFLETGMVHHLSVDSQTKKVTVHLNTSPRDNVNANTNASINISNNQYNNSMPHQHQPNQVYYFYVGSIDALERQLLEAQKELEIQPHDFIPVQYRSDSQSSSSFKSNAELLINALFSGAMIYMLYKGLSSMGSMMGGMGGGGKGGRNIFSIGKSPAQVFKPGEYTKVTFADVAGLDEAKVEVMEFVQFLKHPQKFTKLGAKVPKGALLCGPPGTGKTLLAKAMAGEASVPFFSISGSDFIEMFVGVGPSRVRDLFADARKQAPCIIFIDEIDAVGRERGKGKFGGGNDERENTLNQMLVEMDGFKANEGIVVLAGTNRKDILDPALLRPGRFDRTITIDRPDLRGREQIFNVHLNKIKTSEVKTELAPRLAALTPGFAGADIANLCNEAALIAARSDKASVELIDFEKAADRIIGGLEKKHNIMSLRERTLVAYHEAGHAVVGWFLAHTDPVLKVTIVPRSSGALGFAQSLPNELHLYQQEQLLDMMCMTLGGRAAENLFLGKVSTGAADDLKKVTRLAQAQIAQFGMSARLGNVSYANDDEGYQKPFSESTGQLIDEEVRILISSMYDRTQSIVSTYKDKIEALALHLLEKETVNHDMLVTLLGPRPYPSDSYTKYLDSLKQQLTKVKVEKEGEEGKVTEEATTKADETNVEQTPTTSNTTDTATPNTTTSTSTDEATSKTSDSEKKL